MKALHWIIILLFVNLATTWAYQSFYGQNTSTSNDAKRGMPNIVYSFNKQYAEKFTSFFDFNNKKNYTYQDLSDAAVYLMQLGRFYEAKDVLIWLHEQHPEEYNIVSNLATAMELLGEYDSAVIYLQKAILQKPTNKGNSDWVHLKLLEAKKRMAEDSTWVLHNAVINLRWDTVFYAAYPDSLYSKKQRDSLRQIRYERYSLEFDTLWQIGMQMRIQIPFCSVPNLLVANVMNELASYYEVNVSIKDAFVAYKIAQYFDPQDQLKTQEKLKKLMPFFKKYDFKESLFEEKFYPAAAFSEEDLKKLETYHATQASTSALFWEVKLALASLGIVLLVLLVQYFKNKKNNA